MPNHYFRFKQFRVDQEDCAMKVCTDSCLFGAWMVEQLQEPWNDLHPFSNALDIGTGTGLLSLMLAQEYPISIDAVEIDHAAAKQAIENFSHAPFASRLQLIHADIQEWQPSKKYDVILSNPPFFEADLTSPDSKRNLAMHSQALGLKELVRLTENLLHEHGMMGLILPFHRKQEILDLAADHGLFPWAIADVKQTSLHPCFRVFICFGRTSKTPLSETIIISDNRVYSDRFKMLLKNYYLAF